VRDSGGTLAAEAAAAADDMMLLFVLYGTISTHANNVLSFECHVDTMRPAMVDREGRKKYPLY
jgi:hypothetical protein